MKKLTFFVLFGSFLFLNAGFSFAEEAKSEETVEKVDKDKDGVIDEWLYHDPKGVVTRVGRDSNKDGKMDSFMDFLKGRTLVLWEIDRNFDGKIDKRQLDRWGERRLVPGQPPVPGYKMIWREEDNNFDGIIDAYKESGSLAKAVVSPIGQPIVSGYSPEKIKKIQEKYA